MVRFCAFEVSYKADTTGVVLLGWIVKPLSGSSAEFFRNGASGGSTGFHSFPPTHMHRVSSFFCHFWPHFRSSQCDRLRSLPRSGRGDVFLAARSKPRHGLPRICRMKHGLFICRAAHSEFPPIYLTPLASALRYVRRAHIWGRMSRRWERAYILLFSVVWIS